MTMPIWVCFGGTVGAGAIVNQAVSLLFGLPAIASRCGHEQCARKPLGFRAHCCLFLFKMPVVTRV